MGVFSMRAVLCGVLSAGVLCGCAGMPMAISPSSSPLPAGVQGTIPAYGSDCEYYLLGLIPLSGSPNTQQALDDAKEDAGVDVLTDVTVDYGGSYYILFSNNCSRVRGKGVPRDVLQRALQKERCGCN